MVDNTNKRGISLTLDKDLLIWIEDVSEKEKLSISYIVNRFCKEAKTKAERTGFVFPIGEAVEAT
ncbi:MAG: hypothetical protein DRQ42_00390 [Gammaproteobacteria bacterium]|nr:MAG: hypothetical protein DRQ42_00390 [Gammaproteobacteria bacterium]